MWAEESSPEIHDVPGADVIRLTEGNIGVRMHRAKRGTSAHRLWRDGYRGTHARVAQEPGRSRRLRREPGTSAREKTSADGMAETSSSIAVSTKLERIAKLARELPDRPLTTLAHHIDVEWLREAYRRTRKDGARGPGWRVIFVDDGA